MSIKDLVHSWCQKTEIRKAVREWLRGEMDE